MYDNFQLEDTDHKIVGYEWNVDKPEAVVCLIHGIGEHAGRYDRVGETFRKSNIALIGMDLRGHGLSAGKRGHTAPRAEILGDVDKLIQYAQKQHADIPLFLYGHSMGGNIALDYRKRGGLRSVPQGYLVTSPWIILQKKIPGYLYFFTEMVTKVKPDFQMSSKIDPGILGNQDILAKQENQHLVHGKITVETSLEGVKIAEELLNGTLEIRGTEPVKPILLMHGDADKICSPSGSKRIAEQEGERCDYIEWKGLYHEIHNGGASSDGTDVIHTMIDWIFLKREKTV
jgi:acylglycerol lipase